jgi:hypothetical protein
MDEITGHAPSSDGGHRYRQGVRHARTVACGVDRVSWTAWQMLLGTARWNVANGAWTVGEADAYLLGVWDAVTGHSATLTTTRQGPF